MTVYLDNANIPANVGGVSARWSHLTADTPDELHQFADQLGLRRSWYQGRCKHTACPTVDGSCAHFHYDVVAARRAHALRLGAQPVDLRKLGQIISARRPAFRVANEEADDRG